MNLIPTKIEGAYILEFHKYQDERGELDRVLDKEPLKEKGLQIDIVQSYVSYSKEKGTLRGIHCQVAPKTGKKLARCIQGVLYQVIIDLRKDSPTYKNWQGFTTRASDHQSLFIPEGVGNGILTLGNNVIFMNFSSASFAPDCEIGVRYDDPTFNITWPIPIKHISEKDKSWPLFKE